MEVIVQFAVAGSDLHALRYLSGARLPPVRLPRRAAPAARRPLPTLATESHHGRWTFAVDLPSSDSQRHTVRRGGFPTQEAATAALHRMLEGEDGGFSADPNQTVADYLTT